MLELIEVNRLGTIDDLTNSALRFRADDIFYFEFHTSFINKVVCKLKKSQQNLVSKSDTATKTGPML